MLGKEEIVVACKYLWIFIVTFDRFGLKKSELQRDIYIN